MRILLSILMIFLSTLSLGGEVPKENCSAQEAKQAVVQRLDNVYFKDYLKKPINVHSQGKYWNVCSRRNSIPSKIVRVKVIKNSKTCAIKSIIHNEDAVVVWTWTDSKESFLKRKKEYECK